jgi:hypothetical protein
MEVFVKRLIVFLFIGVLITGNIFAQDRNRRQREVSTLTIEGTLKVDRGMAALESGDTLYYVPLLTRFIGFISELKEGAVITVEGYRHRNMVYPAKAIIDGKTYDFTVFSREPALRNRDSRPRMSEDSQQNRRRENNTRPERRRGAPCRRGCDCNVKGRPA